MPNHEQQIANLLFRYAELIDDGRFADCADLFARAVIPMPGGDLGRDAILAMWEGLVIRYPDGTPRTVHQTTNLVIEVADDESTATCRSRFTVLQQTDTLPLQAICSGRYSDTFARDDDGWYFTSRRYSMSHVGDVSQHMRPQT